MGAAARRGVCALSIYLQRARTSPGSAVDSSFVYWANDTTNGVISKAAIERAGSPQTRLRDGHSHASLGVDSTRIVCGCSRRCDRLAAAVGRDRHPSGLVRGRHRHGGVQRQRLLRDERRQRVACTDGWVGGRDHDGNHLIVRRCRSPWWSTRRPPTSATRAVTSTASPTQRRARRRRSSHPGRTRAQRASPSIRQTSTGPPAWSGPAGSVASQAKNTINSAKVLVPGQLQQPTAIATDGVSVYWSLADGSVHRVAVDGTNPITLATKQDVPSALAVDSARVYWTSPTVVEATAK